MECKIYEVGCHAQWLKDELKGFFLWIWESLVGGFISLLGYIPVPGFLQNVGQFQLPPDVIYFAGLFMIPEGIQIMVASMVLRFAIRRIPIIG